MKLFSPRVDRVLPANDNLARFSRSRKAHQESENNHRNCFDSVAHWLFSEGARLCRPIVSGDCSSAIFDWTTPATHYKARRSAAGPRLTQPRDGLHEK